MMCFIISRTLSAGLAVSLNPARKEGMLKSFTGASSKKAVIISCAIYIAACLTVWAIRDPRSAIICAAVSACSAVFYRRMSLKEFGGVTGDLAGWFLEVTELLLIAALVVGGRL